MFDVSLRNWGTGAGEELHWGWESMTSMVRGQFLGHWLCAAVNIWRVTGEAGLKKRVDRIVSELARCQKRDGGQWCGSIPEKYLNWLAHRDEHIGPYQYVLHKTMMGLFHAYAFSGNEEALEVLEKSAQWFYDWSGQFSDEKFNDILDIEVGGMLELWADLYSVTGKAEHLELLNRYDRSRTFEPLLAGEDILSGYHANTTIPEVLGAARAYEVTGQSRWRDIVEAYWKCAVTDRGYFCTGGQTTEEGWTKPFEFAGSLGKRNQEHCTVYNMMRLADTLLRWTGEATYADYMERNLYNGILAQQNRLTGMVSYYLQMVPGGRKWWSSATCDFWCCVGTLIQAHTIHDSTIYYTGGEGLVVCQYIPSQVEWDHNGSMVKVQQAFAESPQKWVIKMSVQSNEAAEFTLKLRLPWWIDGRAKISVNDKSESVTCGASDFHSIKRKWQNDHLRIELPKALTSCPLPDAPDTVAFMDGPVVLAGLCDRQAVPIHGDKDHPESILVPDEKRPRDDRFCNFQGIGLLGDLKFMPLFEVVDEQHTIYLPVSK